jgi:heme-degrading monooxygenase HmoA
MSVIITLRLQGDPKQFEEAAAAAPDRLQSIVERAKEHGLIAHRFYGSDPDKIMVIDEWPDEASFRSFFESTQDEIGPLLGRAGVTGEPEITAWRKLESHDEYGWDAS